MLVRVRACGVCRTDLHVVDDELPDIEVPRVPGHEIVGTIERLGDDTTGFREGERVGTPWLGYTCGTCEYCTSGRENLCRLARFTGYQIDGGYADYAVADVRYDRIMQTAIGFWASKVLLSAVELGVFEALAKAPLGTEALRQRVGIHPRGARLDLSWDPIDERFVTTVFDGSVDVQGDCLPGSRPVGPGETLDVSCRREVPGP